MDARVEDPRVVRSRAAVVDAAKWLFLSRGYAGTTVEEIAALAGIAKRTVYNNYEDKEALFREVVADTIVYAETFAIRLRDELAGEIPGGDLRAALHDLGRQLALGILRPQVIALRRLLVAESQAFPELATEYFERAPGRVIRALAEGFERLGRDGLLEAGNPRRAAEQFAYLVVGEPLDRAVLVGAIPTRAHVVECAREGVETFWARYGRP